MIKVLPATPEQREYFIKPLSKLLSEDEWYSMLEELGFVNERNDEGWSVQEILEYVSRISLSGDFEYATISEFERVLNHLDNLD